jgi:hydrogenase-1 operon protein HyaF
MIKIHPQNSSGNLLPLLHELIHALQQLLYYNQTSCIDLASMPFSEHDEQILRHKLGQGEVRAELNSLGVSYIWETKISGVWWIEHFNVDKQRTGFYLEITKIPEILTSQAADVLCSLEQLQTLINSAN